MRRDRIRPHISGTGIWNRSAGRNTGIRAGTAFPSDSPGGRGAGSHAAKIAPDRGGRAGITYCMERKASGDPDPDYGRGPDGNFKKYDCRAFWRGCVIWPGQDCIQGNNRRYSGGRGTF